MISTIFKLAMSTTSNASRNIQIYRNGNTKVARRIYHAIAVCAALVTLGALDVANAQYQPTYSQNQVRTYSRSDVERFIRDVERSSQDFHRDFDTWLDRSRDGQQREDVYNRPVHDLTDALTTLRSNFNSRNDWWLARSDMQRVLSAATSVNSQLNNREVRGGLNRQWRALRTNINTLADAFNLPQVGTTFAGIQTYPEYGGSGRNCTTTGTFRGYTNTGETELTLSANGLATARSLNYNALYNGRCANDVLYFDWGSFRLVRDGRNNIATVEIGNERNRTSYRRVSGGYTGDVGPSYPDQYGNGNVPSWAVGTFRGMTDRGESELSIAANGVATARSLNADDFGTGRYANGILTFDWGSFRVEQDGNGIVTVDNRNRRNRTSYRRISGYAGNVVPTYPTDQYGNVPSWAVGRFRGVTADGDSELTISADGVVTARSLNTNQLFNGRYANGVLTFDWGSFRIAQESSGIRTEELNNPQNRTSYRRVD
ncbi:MAG: hypothetical protein ABJB61_02315 [bacterium]